MPRLNSYLRRVISGGQTGADQAGLRAAQCWNIARGGWLPNGCITLDGPRPDLLKLHSMKEYPVKGYPPRTEANVVDSDGTIRIAYNFSSAGEKCTYRFIARHNKPYIDVQVTFGVPMVDKDPEEVVAWIKRHAIKVLNVAGNAEGTAPGIGDKAFEFLCCVFQLLENPNA